MTIEKKELVNGVYDIYVNYIEQMLDSLSDDDFGEQAECEAIDYLADYGLNTYKDEYAREILNAGKDKALKEYDMDYFE